MDRTQDITFLSRDHRYPSLTEIIHLADLHVHSGDRRCARIEEYRQVFWSFLDLIRERESVKHGSAILVICGDVIHNKQKLTTDSTKLWFEWMNELLELLPVLVICGNHDVTQIDLTSTDFLDMVCTPYAYGVTRHPLHYLKKSGIYAWEDVAFGVVSIKETLDNTKRSGRVEELPSFPAPPGRDQFKLRVALFHGIISQWTGAARVLNTNAAAHGPIARTHPMEWFKGYDWLLLGDIHLREMGIALNGELTWAYPGSMIQQNFGETVHGHGFLVWSLQDGFAPSTVPISAFDIHNDHAYISIHKDRKGRYIVAMDNQNVPLEQMMRLPTKPRVRIFGGRVADESAVRTLLAERGAQPSVVKMVRTSKKHHYTALRGLQDVVDVPDEEEKSLVDLNNPSRWVEYIKSKDYQPDVSANLCDIILNPDKLLLSEMYDIDADIVSKIKAYNQAIQKVMNVYHQEAQSLSISRHNPARFLSMSWDYLMCYGKDNFIDFDKLDGGIALMNGKNASGKSSFFDVICIALFGEITSNRKDVPGENKSAMIIYNGKPTRTLAQVSMDIQIGDESFRLYRSFEAKASGYKQPVSAWVKTLNDKNEIIADGTIHVDAWVVTNIGKLDEMLMSNMLCQNDNTNFFMKKKVEQKAILEKALHIETITAFGNVVEESAKAYKGISAKLHDFVKGLMVRTEHHAAACDGPDNFATISDVDVVLQHTLEKLHALEERNSACTDRYNKLREVIGILDVCQEDHQHTDALEIEDYGDDELSRSEILRIISERDALHKQERMLLDEADALNAGVVPCEHTMEELRLALCSMEERYSRHCSVAPVSCMLTRSYISNKKSEYEQWKQQSRQEWVASVNAATIEKARVDRELRKANEELEVLMAGAVSKPTEGDEQIPVYEQNLDQVRLVYEDWTRQCDALLASKPHSSRDMQVIEKELAQASQWKQKYATTVALSDDCKRLQSLVRELTLHAVPKPNVTKPSDEDLLLFGPSTELQMESYRRNVELLKRSQQVLPSRRCEDLTAWMEKLCAWEQKYESVPKESSSALLRQRLHDVEALLTSLETAQMNHEKAQQDSNKIRESIAIYASEPHNDDCWACRQRPVYARLQALHGELAQTESDVQRWQVSVDQLLCGKQEGEIKAEVDALTISVKELEDYEASRASMMAEKAAWETAVSQWNQEAERQQQLSAAEATLSKALWIEYDTWNHNMSNAMTELERKQRELTEFEANNTVIKALQTELDVANFHEEWNNRYCKAKARLNHAHVALYKSWKEQVKCVKCAISSLDVQLQSVSAFIREAEYWKGELFRLDESERHLDVEESWKRERDALCSDIKLRKWSLQWRLLEEHKRALKGSEVRLTCQRVFWIRELRNVEVMVASTQADIDQVKEQLFMLRETRRRLSSMSSLHQKYFSVLEEVDLQKSYVDRLYTLFVGAKRGGDKEADPSSGFRGFIYRTQVVPLIEDRINQFLQDMDGDLKVVITFDGDGLNYHIEHAGHRVSLSHGSGYQKFIIGLAMRASLARIGAVGQNIKHLFIDEGFVALDSDNITKVRDILESMMDTGGFRSVILMSHLDSIREIADMKIDIERRCHYHNNLPRFSSSITWGDGIPVSQLVALQKSAEHLSVAAATKPQTGSPQSELDNPVKQPRRARGAAKRVGGNARNN